VFDLVENDEDEVVVVKIDVVLEHVAVACEETGAEACEIWVEAWHVVVPAVLKEPVVSTTLLVVVVVVVLGVLASPVVWGKAGEIFVLVVSAVLLLVVDPHIFEAGLLEAFEEKVLADAAGELVDAVAAVLEATELVEASVPEVSELLAAKVPGVASEDFLVFLQGANWECQKSC